MDSHIPYYYVIEEKSTGKKYIGSKYGKDADPEKLLTNEGYLTSSAIIKDLISTNGLDSFKIDEIIIFKTGEEAHHYETQQLQKLDAANDPNYYNCHNNDNNFGLVHWTENLLEQRNSKSKLTSQQKYGTDNPFQNKSVKELHKKILKEKYGVENISQIPSVKEKKKATCLKKYGVDNYMKTEEYVQQTKQTKLEKYGSEGFNNREKSKTSSLEKYGVDNPSKSKEVKTKRKQTFLKKYGVENFSQTELGRQKLKEYRKSPEYLAKFKVCPYCNKGPIDPANYSKHHGDNCKLKE
jgi:hypothetical protein